MTRSRFFIAIVAVLLVLGTAGAVSATDYQDPGSGGGGGCGGSLCGCTPSSSQVYVCAYSCSCSGGVIQYRTCTECPIR